MSSNNPLQVFSSFPPNKPHPSLFEARNRRSKYHSCLACGVKKIVYAIQFIAYYFFRTVQYLISFVKPSSKPKTSEITKIETRPPSSKVTLSVEKPPSITSIEKVVTATTTLQPPSQSSNDRDLRIISDPKLIEEKLQRELAIVQRHLEKQKDNSLLDFTKVTSDIQVLLDTEADQKTASRMQRELENVTDPVEIEERRAYINKTVRSRWLEMITAKKKGPSLQGSYFDVGSCEFLGGKTDMEDVLGAQEKKLTLQESTHELNFFWVADGHGGKQAANYLTNHLEDVLIRHLVAQNPKTLSNMGIWNGLKLTCVDLSDKIKVESTSGTTFLLTMIIDGKQLWTANVGDSRAVLCQQGKSPIQLSADQQIENPPSENDNRYLKSILKRKGQIIHGTNRLMDIHGGSLESIRALGDREFPGLTSRPKITYIDLAKTDNSPVLVLATDGLWKRMSSNQVDQWVQKGFSKPSPDLATEFVSLSYFFDPRHSDNTSVIVVKIQGD